MTRGCKFRWVNTQQFQSTLPCREWLDSFDIHLLPYYFNPHSRAGSDSTGDSTGSHLHFDFNPHSRAGSDAFLADWLKPCSNFNPHSRAGSDDIHWKGYKRGFISIHTPVQGVTIQCCVCWLLTIISIHTPVQGVTSNYTTELRFICISIHTPVQGVTTSKSRQCSLRNISIHTPVQGVTVAQWMI